MNFQCPYCFQHTTITSPNKFTNWERIFIEESEKGNVGFSMLAITCPNVNCKKLYLKVDLTNAEIYQYASWNPTKTLQTWQLLPESESRVFPSYVPPAVIKDYSEACRIKNLSPKASATLARRCLQGMIRDFWGIKKKTLREEVDALKSMVNSLTWEAIDSVRSVGNIGAHMEKDINLLIDVDPEEAQLLISLIEQLINDWYIERHEKEERLQKIKNMADKKKNIKEEKGRGNTGRQLKKVH